MYKKIFCSLVALSGLMADEPEVCDISVLPERLTARHIEAKGIGYTQGYSTIEGFFTHPDWINGSFVPFLDLRGHIFNNGKPAANAGIGLRYLDSMVWGLNAYYDYRKTEHQNYNQVSLGFEALGEVWDFRLNGYLPVGRTKSHFYHPKFHEFKQHHMILSLKKEFAMTGTNAEVGAHFNAGRYVDLYAAAGPYYFAGDGKHAIGGQGRLYGTIWDYVGLEVKGSYDNVFRGIIQGEISFIIPFSSKKQVKKREGRSCSREKALRKRAYQRVDRQEIIILDHKREHKTAINPATGEPWFFWFVNNTSHSLGTFESPFPTLVQAQNASSINDVIYVFSGDGTSTGMNQGITLKNNQKLFGSGVKQHLKTTQGKVKIPAFTESFPLLTNPTLTQNIIVLANGNELSGLNVVRNNNLLVDNIVGNGINGVYIHDNNISGGLGGSFNLNLFAQGQVIIENNQFSIPTLLGSQGILIATMPGAVITGRMSHNVVMNYFNGVRLAANNGGSFDFEFANNTLNHDLSITAAPFAFLSSTGVNGPSILRIFNNRVTNDGPTGLTITQTGQPVCAFINNNQISGTPDFGIVIQTNSSAVGSFKAIISNNEINNPTAGDTGIAVGTNGQSSICLKLTNNRSFVETGYFLSNSSGTLNLARPKDNVGSFKTTGTITSVKRDACDCDDD